MVADRGYATRVLFEISLLCCEGVIMRTLSRRRLDFVQPKADRVRERLQSRHLLPSGLAELSVLAIRPVRLGFHQPVITKERSFAHAHVEGIASGEYVRRPFGLGAGRCLVKSNDCNKPLFAFLVPPSLATWRDPILRYFILLYIPR